MQSPSAILCPRRRDSDLKEGTHVGRYQILGLLGKGGMGAVYKAYDPELDRSIAIKILTVKPHEGETASRPQARLMREAQALAKLSHPNVVSIFDVGTYEDSVYIAMEYVKGKTLREWLKDVCNQTKKEILKSLAQSRQRTRMLLTPRELFTEISSRTTFSLETVAKSKSWILVWPEQQEPIEPSVPQEEPETHSRTYHQAKSCFQRP